MKKMMKYFSVILIVMAFGFSSYAASGKSSIEKNPQVNPFEQVEEDDTSEEKSTEEQITENEKDEASAGDAEIKEKETEKKSEDKSKDKSDEKKPSKRTMIIIAAALFVVLIVLVILILIVASGKKKNKDEEDAPGDENDAMNSSGYKKMGYTISDSTTVGAPIVIDVYKNGSLINTIQAKVDSSLIIGRESICDVVVNNENLSAQHLVIEYSDEAFYVQDLNTKNGTFFNGIKMKHKRRLEKGDRLKIGEMELVIRW